MLRCLRLTAAALLAAGLGATGYAAPGRNSGDTPHLPSDDLFTNPRRSFHRFDDFVFTPTERRAEAAEKVARVRKELAERKLDGVVIGSERNFEWITGGGKDSVIWSQESAPVKLLVMTDKLYLIANNIEGPRVMTEELDGLGYTWQKFNWYTKESEALSPLIHGKKVVFDQAQDAAAYGADAARAVYDFAPLYYPITAGELKKYRWLGRKTADVIEQIAAVIRPGMSERDVQYLLERELWYWDIFPTVVLSAVDERFTTYHHPVVKGETLKSYVALNVCARRWGQIVSTTRMLYFGDLPPTLEKAWKDGATVTAATWAATKPGKTLGDVLDEAEGAYTKAGFRDEWKMHHQGGPILTQERLYLVKPGDKTKVIPGMVLAWNPTLQGTKFEDTVVVKQDGTLENLTLPNSSKWPTADVKLGAVTYKVPTVMVRPLPKSDTAQ